MRLFASAVGFIAVSFPLSKLALASHHRPMLVVLVRDRRVPLHSDDVTNDPRLVRRFVTAASDSITTPTSDVDAFAMPAPHHLDSEAVESRWDGPPAPEGTSASA